MKPVIVGILLPLLIFGQAMPFPGPGMIHAVGNAASISSSNKMVCNNTTLTCSITSVVVGSGNAVAVGWLGCFDVSCLLGPGTCSVSVAETFPTNTYTSIPSARTNDTISSITYNIYSFLAVNATAGTYDIQVTISGVGCTIYYSGMFVAVVSGAKTSSVLDLTACSGGCAGSGTSASPSITSAGNVQTAGSVAIGFANTDNAITFTGAFSLLDSQSTSHNSAKVIGPSSGAPLTFAGTMTSGKWWEVMMIIQPL